jgi:tetrapyrrole methylase family protein/MazG family protein
MKNPFQKIWEIVIKLRSPEGCPWDRAQTNESLKYDIIEEAYEVLEAINRKDDEALGEELGDLLFLILLHLRIAEEEGRLTLEEVVNRLVEKMVKRHPHVFGNKKYKRREHLTFWEKSKGNVMEGISLSMPALLMAQKAGEKARRVGFDWDRKEDVLAKVKEELDELIKAINSQNRDKIFEEFGDLLFSLVNLARHLEILAEDALRESTKKFIRRFEKIEELAKREGKSLEDMTLGEMDILWEKTKNEREKG